MMDEERQPQRAEQVNQHDDGDDDEGAHAPLARAVLGVKERVRLVEVTRRACAACACALAVALRCLSSTRCSSIRSSRRNCIVYVYIISIIVDDSCIGIPLGDSI